MGKFRRTVARMSIVLTAAGSIAVATAPGSASAYALDGCKQAGYTNTGIYHIVYRNSMTSNTAAGTDGISGWNYSAAKVWFETGSSPKVVMNEGNYGSTGWAGHTNRPCSYGVYTPPSTTQ